AVMVPHDGSATGRACGRRRIHARSAYAPARGCPRSVVGRQRGGCRADHYRDRAGTIQDSQGGVVPGATVVLVSEARGTRSLPAVTNATGDYVFPNTTADTYTVEVTMPGFRTLTRAGVTVSAGERVSVPVLTLEPGGAQETVTVIAESPLVQASSGERSFAVTTEQIENLPINRGDFTSLTAFTPGVVSGGASAAATRLGGAGQNNIMMDGISAMDTGNNG